MSGTPGGPHEKGGRGRIQVNFLNEGALEKGVFIRETGTRGESSWGSGRGKNSIYSLTSEKGEELKRGGWEKGRGGVYSHRGGENTEPLTGHGLAKYLIAAELWETTCKIEEKQKRGGGESGSRTVSIEEWEPGGTSGS